MISQQGQPLGAWQVAVLLWHGGAAPGTAPCGSCTPLCLRERSLGGGVWEGRAQGFFPRGAMG